MQIAPRCTAVGLHSVQPEKRENSSLGYQEGKKQVNVYGSIFLLTVHESVMYTFQYTGVHYLTLPYRESKETNQKCSRTLSVGDTPFVPVWNTLLPPRHTTHPFVHLESSIPGMPYPMLDLMCNSLDFALSYLHKTSRISLFSKSPSTCYQRDRPGKETQDFTHLQDCASRPMTFKFCNVYIKYIQRTEDVKLQQTSQNTTYRYVSYIRATLKNTGITVIGTMGLLNSGHHGVICICLFF